MKPPNTLMLAKAADGRRQGRNEAGRKNPRGKDKRKEDQEIKKQRTKRNTSKKSNNQTRKWTSKQASAQTSKGRALSEKVTFAPPMLARGATQPRLSALTCHCLAADAAALGVVPYGTGQQHCKHNGSHNFAFKVVLCISTV